MLTRTHAVIHTCLPRCHAHMLLCTSADMHACCHAHMLSCTIAVSEAYRKPAKPARASKSQQEPSIGARHARACAHAVHARTHGAREAHEGVQGTRRRVSTQRHARTPRRARHVRYAEARSLREGMLGTRRRAGHARRAWPHHFNPVAPSAARESCRWRRPG